MSTSRFVDIPGPAGATLTGRLRPAAPTSTHRGAAVLCHPHPAFGGNMDVWLLPIVGQALAEAGWTVLRFDFRSVREGVSPDGHLDDHAAERADLAAAITFLQGRAEPVGPRLALVGWSFGALVALLHGLDEPAVTDWVGIAPAVCPLPELPMAAVPGERVRAWSARRVVVAGAHDQFFPPDHVTCVHAHETHVLDDADHFFFDRDRDVAALVSGALARAGEPA